MGLIVILILLVCLITSVPIAISLGIATLVGLFLISPDFLGNLRFTCGGAVVDEL